MTNGPEVSCLVCNALTCNDLAICDDCRVCSVCEEKHDSVHLDPEGHVLVCDTCESKQVVTVPASPRCEGCGDITYADLTPCSCPSAFHTR